MFTQPNPNPGGNPTPEFNDQAMTERPNILFLMSDEHRPDVTGFEGNGVVRTPVLDELARTGVVFRNAYTPSPICVPGRQCMMSGQFPSACGARGYGQDLPPFHMTFARRFAQYAYQTVCSGKLHHMGVDQMQGWTKRVSPDCEVAVHFVEGRVEAEFERYRPQAGTGKWSNQKEIERAGISVGQSQLGDARATQAAIDFLEKHFCDAAYDRPLSHRPLLLKLSLVQPHYPFLTDREKFTHYLNRVPVCDETVCDHPRLSRTQAGPLVQASIRDKRRATAAYYGMIEQVDSHYGDLMRALEHVAQNLDDWIIVYTSDHGEMLGQHGIWEKTQYYEGSVRVPLVIRWPRRFAPRVVEENVNLCDLFSTLCDLAGIVTPDGLDSRSLVPLMNGENAGWDNETVSQLGHELMIKRDALKYLWFGPDVPEVLFDLASDPGECRNVLDDARHAEPLARFCRRRDELGFGVF